MDMNRTIALVVFMVSALFLWEAWQKQNLPSSAAPTRLPPPVVTSQAPPTAVPAPSPATTPSAASTSSAQQTSGAGVTASAQRVRVITDKLAAEIDTAGGDIRRLTLLDQKGQDSDALTLMQDRGTPIYFTQSGLLGQGLPTHNTMYSAGSQSYQLAAGQAKLEVRLVAPVDSGLQAVKILTFHRGSYVIDVGYEIHNTGTTAIAAHAYYQFLRDSQTPSHGVGMASTFTGPALYTEAGKFQKIAFSDIDKGKFPSRKAHDGWVAMVQHYFVAAWLPKGSDEREF